MKPTPISIQKLCANHPDSARAIRAVASRLDLFDLSSISNHGAYYGVPGFIYYSQIRDFFRKFRRDIIALYIMYARMEGMSVEAWILSLPKFSNDPKWGPIVSRCLYTGRLNDDTSQVETILVYGLLEFVAEELVKSNKQRFN